MSKLLNFPIVNQLNRFDTIDGRPSENYLYNCVPASIAAGLEYLTGKKYVPDQLKDAAYGEGLENSGTAAFMYITFCAKQGVRLFSVSGSPSYLLSQAHAYLAKGLPVIFTEPDPYSKDPSLSHVCVFCEDGPGTITFLDPFGGHFVTRSDAAQLNNLLFNQIWIMQKVETNTVQVPLGWHDDGHTLIAPNGVKVVLGFRQFVLGHAWDPQNYPTDIEYHTDQLEVSNQSLGPGQQQIFRMSMLGYTTQRGVFFEWLGQELAQTRSLAQKLHSQVVAQAASIADLQKQLADAQANPVDAKYQELVKHVKDLESFVSAA